MSTRPSEKRASDAIVYAMMALGVVLIAAGIGLLLPILDDVADGSQPPEDFAVTALAETPNPAPQSIAVRADPITGRVTPGTLATAVPTSIPTAIPMAIPMAVPTADKDAPAKMAISGVPVAMAPQKSAPQAAAARPIPGYEEPKRIIIPAIKLNAPVEEADFVVQPGKDTGYWEVPDKAAGWHTNSAELGEQGNLVMSGHNNLGTRVFANLRLLKPNDEIVVQGDTFQQRYVVIERKLLLELGQPPDVQARNARYILPDLGDTRLTLVTCWPPTGNSHRIIVIAQPVGEPGKRSS
jgi:LPXTG-site transpeptidase (sortase) family protein